MAQLTKKKRFKPYLRLSSELQEAGYGLPSQESDVRDYVARNEGVIVEPIFKDTITGDSSSRPDLDRLRALLYTGEIDAVVFPRVDRAGRQAVVILELCYEILDAGVELHVANLGLIENNEAGRFMLAIHAGVAQYDKAMTVRKLTDGRRAKYNGDKTGVRRPVGNGPRPYGFRYVGKRESTQMQLVPHEAAVMQRVYRLLYDGNGEFDGPLGMAEVARILTKEGIPTAYDTRQLEKEQLGIAQKTGKAPQKKAAFGVWSKGQLHKLVRNPLYKGLFAHNRYYPVKKQGGKTHWKERRWDDPQLVWIEVPAVVDPLLWDAVNAHLHQNNLNHLARSKPIEYPFLLRGVVYCECGYQRSSVAVNPKGRPRQYYYRCNGRQTGTVRSCSSEASGHSARAVDFAVWQWVEQTILQRENLATALAQLQESKAQVIEDLQQRRNLILGQIQEVTARRQRMLDAYEAGAIGLGELTASNQQKDQMLAQYQEALAEVDERIESSGAVINVQQLLDITEQVRGKMTGATPQERRRLIDIYGVEATLGIDPKTKERVAYVTCYLTDDPQRVAVPKVVRGGKMRYEDIGALDETNKT